MSEESEEAGLGSLKTIVKGTSIVFVGLIVANILNYLTRIIIGRQLGPDNYGLLSICLAVLGIATMVSLFGLDNGITRYISYFRGKNDERGIKGTITSSLKLSLPVSVLIAIAVFMFANDISISIFHNSSLTPLMQLFALAIPFNTLLMLFTASIRGMQRARYKVYSNDLFYPIAKIALVSSFIWIGYDVIGASLGWVISLVAASILTGYFLEKKTFPVIKTKITSKPVHRELLRFSLPLMIASMLSMVIAWTDTILLGLLKNTAEVGVYNAALPTSTILNTVLTAFYFLFMPVVSELFSKNKIKELKVVFSTINRWIVTFTLPAFILMFLFPGTVLNILFGEDYLSGALSLSILSFGEVFYIVVAGMASSVLLSLGRTKVSMAVNLLIAVTNLLLNLILIPTTGMLGAAIAMAVSFILGSTMNVYILYRLSGIQPFSRAVLKPILVGFVTGVSLFFIAKFVVTGMTIPLALILGFFFLLTYALLLLVMKPFCKEDIEIMKAVETKTGFKFSFVRRIIKRFI